MSFVTELEQAAASLRERRIDLERSRTGDGQYAEESEGEMNPDTFKKAYSPGWRTAAVGVGGAAAVGIGLLPKMRRFGGKGVFGGADKAAQNRANEVRRQKYMREKETKPMRDADSLAQSQASQPSVKVSSTTKRKSQETKEAAKKKVPAKKKRSSRKKAPQAPQAPKGAKVNEITVKSGMKRKKRQELEALGDMIVHLNARILGIE